MGSGFLGRYWRGIQAADANLAGSVADHDNALVSLPAEVARTHIRIRTLEERLGIAYKNIEIQKESLRIAEVRFRHGATTELDVQQARAALANTEALVPATQGALRQAKNGLSILLGLPPGDWAGCWRVRARSRLRLKKSLRAYRPTCCAVVPMCARRNCWPPARAP